MALSITSDYGKTLSDAWDYKGLPANRSKTGGWISSAMILGVETCERLITLGIAFSLVTYLTGVMHLGNVTAANTVTNFLGTSFMLCLLGGFVADTFLGRYLTIAIFATVQALGVTILTISTIIPNLRPPSCPEKSSTCIQANSTQLGVLHLALYLTALGTGGLKSGVSGFGSDQFDDKNEGEKARMSTFFNWFYFIVSFGSLAAVTILVYIEDNLGRKWGYGICTCAIVVCLIVFLCGTKRYRFKKLTGSPLTQFGAVLVAAWRNRKLDLPSDSAQLFNVDDVSSETTSVKSKQKLPHSKQFRYLTIAIFAAVQATGLTILTVSTAIPSLRPPPCTSQGCEPASGAQLGVLYLALYLTALGTGGVKSSVSGFGSDQFDETDKEEHSLMTLFFNWFFCIISIGSLIAVTVLVYIQDHMGRPWGYGIIACTILLALSVFLSGTRRYRFTKLAGSPLTQIATVLVAAFRKRNMELPSDPSLLHNIGEKDFTSTKQRLAHTTQFRFLDKAAIKGVNKGESESKWRLSTLTDVEEVKLLIRMLPIWATTIMFWTIYAQMTTLSVSQATTMDRHIGPSFKIPPASLTSFFVGTILIIVPIYDRIIVPIGARFLHNPQGLTQLQRIAVGLVFSILAMISASLVEIKRLHTAQIQGLMDKKGAIVPITVFWLIPQFSCVGAGAAFMYIGQLDFFLRECPKGMKTMSAGLFMSTLALGFYISSILVTIVQKLTIKRPWIADNLNHGSLQSFYLLLAIMGLVNFFVYLVFAKWYRYKKVEGGYESEVDEDKK